MIKQTLYVIIAALWAPLLAQAEEVLLKENFDRLPVGRVLAGKYPHIVAWEGPSRQFGWVGITDEYPQSAAAPKDHLNVIALYDRAAEKNKAPSLQFRWENKDPKPGKQTLSWDFLAPMDKPFMAIHFLGSNWSNSTAAILLSDGNIILHADQGNASRLRIGTYKVGIWHTIKVTHDIAARTLDVWLDGKKVANAISWLAAAPNTIDRLSTVADYAAVERDNAAVLYLDNIEVSTVFAP